MENRKAARKTVVDIEIVRDTLHNKRKQIVSMLSNTYFNTHTNICMYIYMQVSGVFMFLI